MKKIFFVVIILILNITFCQNIFAKSFVPKHFDSIKYPGKGVYFVSETILLHEEPEETSEVLEVIEWNNFGARSFIDKSVYKSAFVTFLPKNKMVLLAVNDETDNWYELIYDQINGRKGWVRKNPKNKFYSWLMFMKTYALKKGIYFFNDLEEHQKYLYSKPDENSQVFDKSFFHPNSIKIKLIRGNWMLVRVIDYDKSMPVGWIRWRGKDGRVYVFPEMGNSISN